MIFGTDVQKVYLGNQEVSKILVQNIEVFSSISLDLSAFTNNLISYWSFDEDSIQPSFGVYTAVLDGGAWFNTGFSVYKQAARLQPSNRIRVPQSLWNVRTGPLSYTVSFWVRKNVTNTTGQHAVMLGSFFGEMGFVFLNQFLDGSNLNNAFSFTLATGSGYQYKAAQAVQTMDNNTWYHLVGTYSLPNETAKLYVNGTLTATTTGVLNNDYTNNNWTGFAMNGSVISNSSSEYGNDYTFDMVGLWSRTLSDNEVQQLYSNYAPINDYII